MSNEIEQLKKEWGRFKKTIKALRKKNLHFIGTELFYVIEKKIEITKSGTGPGDYNHTKGFYIVVESVDGKNQIELVVHPKDYGKLIRKRNQKNPEPIQLAVFQYKETDEYFVTLELNEKKGKKYLSRQAKVALFAVVLASFLAVCSLLFFIKLIVFETIFT